MHVTFLGHAQLLVKAAGKTLLIDPWFAEPVFAGAWGRYPPPPYLTPESLPAQPDFLVLSHAHPDHSGPGTLALLNPALPTLAPRFPEDPLPRRLERAGFRDVRWMEGWETRELASGLKVTYVPHVQPGDEWGPETGAVARGLTARWGHDADSIARYARTQRQRVEQAVAARHRGDRFDADTARLDKAVRLYLGRLVEQSAELTRELAMVAGFEAEGPLPPPGAQGRGGPATTAPSGRCCSASTTRTSPRGSASSWPDASAKTVSGPRGRRLSCGAPRRRHVARRVSRGPVDGVRAGHGQRGGE